jgi:hypothetical protein
VFWVASPPRRGGASGAAAAAAEREEGGRPKRKQAAELHRTDPSLTGVGPTGPHVSHQGSTSRTDFNNL